MLYKIEKFLLFINMILNYGISPLTIIKSKARKAGKV